MLVLGLTGDTPLSPAARLRCLPHFIARYSVSILEFHGNSDVNNSWFLFFPPMFSSDFAMATFWRPRIRTHYIQYINFNPSKEHGSNTAWCCVAMCLPREQQFFVVFLFARLRAANSILSSQSLTNRTPWQLVWGWFNHSQHSTVTWEWSVTGWLHNIDVLSQFHNFITSIWHGLKLDSARVWSGANDDN